MINGHPSENQLNDYADGLLALSEREEIDGHLGVCHACVRELHQLQSLLTGLGSLPKAIRPGEDLRPGIRARIGHVRSGPVQEARSRRSPLRSVRYPLAAAAVLLVTLASAATLLLERGSEHSRPAAAAAPAPASAAGDVAFARFQMMEAEYARAADELRSALEGREGLIDPATEALLSRNLRIIDRAIQESRAALLADPGSEMLREMVLKAHERKLEMLRRAETLSATS